ncbi:hypothetical protein Hdeb2414_s0004g00131691 [Helianthus debilis subsp. tardiflorus]
MLKRKTLISVVVIIIFFSSGRCVQRSVFYSCKSKLSMCFNIMVPNCLFEMDTNMFDSRCTMNVFKSDQF